MRIVIVALAAVLFSAAAFASSPPTATAVGAGAAVYADGATAVGAWAEAQTVDSTAVGAGAVTVPFSPGDGHGATAVGGAAWALGVDATAVGYNATSTSDGATALGSYAYSAGPGSVAIGNAADAGFDNDVAIGNNARTTAGGVGAVAIGNGAFADQPGTVSVGSDATDGTGFTSRIVNVAPGIDPTDVVNVSQMRAGDALTLRRASAYVDLRVGQLTQRLNAAVAQAAAATQMVATFAGADPDDANRLAVGAGWQGGQTALAVGYQHVSTDSRFRPTWNAGVAAGGRGLTLGVGAGLSW